MGNRLARNSSLPGILADQYAYDANDRLLSDQYDNNGNTRAASMRDPATLVSHPVADQYNFENQLTDRNNGQIRLVYDGDGHRVRKTVVNANRTVTTYYLVDDLNPTGYAQVLEELTTDTANPALNSPQVTHTYVWGHALLAQDQFAEGLWIASYYGYDGQGSVRYLTDANGQVSDTYDYDAFGNLLYRTGNTPNNYLYQGEQYDADLKLYYLRARYADSDRGRFWSMDSFEGVGTDPQSLHKYSFNQNNPVNRRDPSGHESMEEAGTAAGFAPMVRGALMVVQQCLTSCVFKSAAICGAYGGLINEAITGMVDAYTGNESTPAELMKAFVAGFEDGFTAGAAIAFSPFTAGAYMGYTSIVAGLDL